MNNFSAQEHALSKNRHNLNFRVMVVRDGKLSMKVFVEICILISGCLAILEVKVLVEVSSFCLSNYFRKSVAETAKESSTYLH